ncbi:MAG TPA: hypothetical protein P5250_07435, partial [Bacteroidales bacterium]|nr:hypothetical protein [Bacteroidales bacterium]
DITNDLNSVKISHNGFSLGDRGIWRKFNPYNPYSENKEKQEFNMESLDDLFNDNDEEQNIVDNEEKKQTENNLSSNNNSNKEQVNTNIPASSLNYKFDPSAFHFFVVIVNAKSNDISQLRNLISDHNKLYFSLEKLNTTNIFFTTNEQMITVSNFKDKEKAMTYYYSIEKNNNLRTMLDKLNANKFIISAENYSTLYKQKNVEDYKQFFIKNYLNL